MIHVSDEDVREVMRRIRGVGKAMRKHQRAALNIAAQPLIEEIQARAPESEKAHRRYSTAKLVKGLKAPKGSGNVVATYQPGNLRESFGVLPLRRTKNVIVGAKASRGGGGEFGTSGRADGYYAHMVEFGTIHAAPAPFVRPSLMATKDQVLRIAVDQLKLAVERYERGLPPMRRTKTVQQQPDYKTFDEL